MGKLREFFDRLDALMSSSTRRALLFAALIGAIFFVVKLIADEWFSAHLSGPLKQGLLFLASQPMGYGGLLAVGAVVLCVLAAFVDTSPNAVVLKEWLSRRGAEHAQAAAAVPALSDDEKEKIKEEKEEVLKIRHAWMKTGRLACGALYSLLDQVLFAYARKHSVGGFLFYIRDQLSRTSARVEKAVASVESLEDVQAYLNNNYESYGLALSLIQVIHEKDMPISGGEYKKILEVWQAIDEKWRDRLEELSSRPKNEGKLRNFSGARTLKIVAPTPPEQSEPSSEGLLSSGSAS